MTEKLFLRDSYLKEFDATVLSVADGKFFVLDKTAFYPQGGGQPSDTGKVVDSSEQEFNVVFAKKLGDEVSHEANRIGLCQGSKVHGVIDWEKRYKNMRMHTAAHVVHGVIFSSLRLLVTGNQLGWPQSRIDINIEAFDKQRFAVIEKKCNAIVSQNLDVSFQFVSKKQAESNPDYFRLMGVDRESLLQRLGGKIGIVKIGDFDESIDGGTHVRNTSEIGKIKFTRFENKGANNRRIYFELLD